MHSEIQVPFDAVAESYDRDFTHSPIGRMQRERVWHFLEKELVDKSPLAILEINCGTGEDALWLARKGHSVTATDASSEMIRMAKTKNPTGPTFEVCPFEAIAERYGHRQFDLVFSNFAGLNCAGPETHHQLSKDFAKLLRPGGLFVAVLLGKKCLMEKLYFLARGNFKTMGRRRQKATAFLAPGQEQETWYYTKKEFLELYRDFKFLSAKPIGLFLPPSYLQPFFNNKGKLLSLLNRCEQSLGNSSLLADYADHVYLVLQKNPDAAP